MFAGKDCSLCTNPNWVTRSKGLRAVAGRIMATKGMVTQDVAGVTRVDIINRRETVRLRSIDRGKGKTGGVRVNGAFHHRVHGMSRSQSTLYLIAFEGTLGVPDDVVVSYKRGVGDLQKELIDTYAPSLSYGKMLETQKVVRSLERYQDVPPAVILEITHRFADATAQRFFASQVEVSAPPNLERIERKLRAQNFRWNGPYAFLEKVQAGQYTVIPELQGAHTLEELWSKILEFLVKKIYLKDDGPLRSCRRAEPGDDHGCAAAHCVRSRTAVSDGSHRGARRGAGHDRHEARRGRSPRRARGAAQEEDSLRGHARQAFRPRRRAHLAGALAADHRRGRRARGGGQCETRPTEDAGHH